MNSDFRVGPWLVQPSLNTISQNGTSKRVESKMMEVLVCLAEHTGEVVPKEKLFQTVWPDTFVSDDVLKRSVSELRRVFGDDAHESRIIETIPRRGYRLVDEWSSTRASHRAARCDGNGFAPTQHIGGSGWRAWADRSNGCLRSYFQCGWDQRAASSEPPVCFYSFACRLAVGESVKRPDSRIFR
ncbi:MAG: hypothetical protein DMG90_00815 [Acidobacteria bacterium]|nr:MAG: hypothetical protein DMG90_00815 [Acidobacteriota bacterium]